MFHERISWPRLAWPGPPVAPPVAPPGAPLRALSRRAGFIGADRTLPNDQVLVHYTDRGTAEQRRNEGELARKCTRLSRMRFAAKVVRPPTTRKEVHAAAGDFLADARSRGQSVIGSRGAGDGARVIIRLIAFIGARRLRLRSPTGKPG